MCQYCTVPLAAQRYRIVPDGLDKGRASLLARLTASARGDLWNVRPK